MDPRRRALASALLAWPLLGRAQADASIVAAARKEGEISLYTSLIAEDMGALSAAFDRKYGIKVKGWRAGSEKVLQRTIAEARANRRDADVIETNGPSWNRCIASACSSPSPRRTSPTSCHRRSLRIANGSARG